MKDTAIIALYQSRNESALGASDERYGRYCYKIAINVLGCEEDAKECVNDTFLAAWERIPPEKPDCLRAFFGKIARNIATNRYHRNRTQKRGGGEIPLVLEELAECVADGTSVEGDLMAKELKKEIDGFLEALPQRDRHVFIERYFYMDSVKDIANRHDMKEDYLRVVLARVRKKLKQHLKERKFI